MTELQLNSKGDACSVRAALVLLLDTTGSHMHIKTMLVAMVTFAAVLLPGRAVAVGQAQPSAESAVGAMDRIILQRMDESGIVGLGAAIIVDRKLVWANGYGFADKGRGVPFGPDTVMNIGSISKTFTGVALMHAVEEGKLDLDEDINAYLPFDVINPFYPNEKITLRHLATHTSGITDRRAVYEGTYHFGGDSPEPLGEFLKGYFATSGKDYSEENFLRFKPGTHRDYSNIAAGLAGYIVEVATGETLNVYARRHIFGPLGMDNTAWLFSEIPPADHSKLYVAQGLSIPIQLYEGTTYPDGGVRTSVADLSKLFIALLGDGQYQGARVLEEKSVAEMTRFQYDASNKPDNVNLGKEDSVNSGIFWATKFDTTRIGHNGSDPGVMTMMLSDLDKEIGVILFANTSLSEQDSGHYGAIYDELWKHAEALKRAEQRTGTGQDH